MGQVRVIGNRLSHCLFAAPRRATLFFNTLPLAANRLIARQLTRKAENLKNAALEIDRSSNTVLDDAKMPRRTAGVTGILLDDWPGGGWVDLSAPKVEGVTVFVEERDTLELDGMTAVVRLADSAIWIRNGRGGRPYGPLATPHTRCRR